jgi:hypothetical protein
MKLTAPFRLFESPSMAMVNASRIETQKNKKLYHISFMKSPMEGLDVPVASLTLTEKDMRRLIKKLKKCIQE